MYAGRLFDGTSAQVRPVSIVVRDTELDLRTPEGAPIDHWPIGELVRSDADAPDGATLRRRTGVERLWCADPGLLAELGRAGALLERTVRWTKLAWTFCLLGVAASLAAAIGLVDRLPGLAAPLVPRVVERTWSNGLETSLVAGSRRCDGSAGRAAVARLLATLMAAAGVLGPPRFTVLDDPQVNAFTLPDGRIVILDGLLSTAGGPDELAGVLAHELGHVAHHDPTREAIRGLEIRMLARILGWSGGVGAQLASLSYGRRAEARADASALATLHRAGLRADGLARFLSRLEASSDGMPDFLSDHPSTAARVRDLAVGPEGQEAMTPADWQATRGVCGRPRPS